MTPVDIQSRPVAAVDPRSPRADPLLEIGAPQQPPTADQDKGVFSALKRIPDVLRPDPPRLRVARGANDQVSAVF